MKKRICLLMMMVLVLSLSLCACSKDESDKDTKKTEASDDDDDDEDDGDKGRKHEDVPELSDKIFIGTDFMVTSSMEANRVDAYIYIYTNRTIVGVYDNVEIYRSTITDEQYNNIASIDREKLYITKIKDSTDVLDGSSYYLLFFGKDGQIIKKLGGYEPKTKFFNECRRTIFDNLPMDEIDECFQAKKDAEKNIPDYYEDETMPYYYVVDNYEGDYYSDGTGVNTYNDIGITLDLVNEEGNNVTDVEAWMAKTDYEAYDISTDDGFVIQCNGYNLFRYSLENSSSFYTYMLDIRDEDDNYLGTLDFSQYRVPFNVVEEEKAFAEVWLHYAWIDPEKNVVYASLAHSTYAESGPETGYIVAVDLSDGHLIWRTPSLTCNSNNFCVLEDTIICGYGFTAEDDYIYQVDINTGIVYKKIKVKSSPDILFIKDGHLFVRCYNTDYDFAISYG